MSERKLASWMTPAALHTHKRILIMRAKDQCSKKSSHPSTFLAPEHSAFVRKNNVPRVRGKVVHGLRLDGDGHLLWDDPLITDDSKKLIKKK